MPVAANTLHWKADPTWTIGFAVPPKKEKRRNLLTCSSRRTVWTDWWFHPLLCWTSPQLLLVPAHGSLRRSPASASFHLSNRNVLWNQTLWKSLKIKVWETFGGGEAGRGLPLNSPGTSLYTMSCRVLSALGKFLNVSEHSAFYIQGTLRGNLSWSVVTDLILSCGHVLWTWTSHRGQNLLVSKKATMQVLQTAGAKSNFRYGLFPSEPIKKNALMLYSWHP